MIKNIIEIRQPAFILLDDKMSLQKSGGDLTKYGLNNIETGESLEDRLFFLDGMFI